MTRRAPSSRAVRSAASREACAAPCETRLTCLELRVAGCATELASPGALSKRVHSSLSDLHILRVVPAADADTADHRIVFANRVTAAKHDQPRGLHNAVEQRRIVLDEVEPAMCGHAESDRGVGLVLGD